MNWGENDSNMMDGKNISAPAYATQVVNGTVGNYTDLQLFDWVTIMNNIGTDWMYADPTVAAYKGGSLISLFDYLILSTSRRALLQARCSTRSSATT